MNSLDSKVLPRLPVPPLEITIERYLKSVKPLLSRIEYEKYSLIANDFLNGQGQTLQKRLIDYDKTQDNSWLENWWLSLAYLSWRESLLVNSNWYIIVQKHTKYGENNHAIKRVSGFITSFLDFLDLIDTGALPNDGSREPLCMYQYTRMFGITRIPVDKEDILVTHQTSKHIIVMIKDQIYAVDVYDENGKRVAVSKIEE